MVNGLGCLSHEERLRKMGLFSLEKVWENHVNVYKYLMEEVKKAELDFSQWCPVKGQEENGPKLKCR